MEIGLWSTRDDHRTYMHRQSRMPGKIMLPANALWPNNEEALYQHSTTYWIGAVLKRKIGNRYHTLLRTCAQALCKKPKTRVCRLMSTHLATAYDHTPLQIQVPDWVRTPQHGMLPKYKCIAGRSSKQREGCEPARPKRQWIRAAGT